MAKYINPKLTPNVREKYFRLGDVAGLYCRYFQNSIQTQYSPQYTFDAGMKELVQWVKLQQGKVENKAKQANNRFKRKIIVNHFLLPRFKFNSN